MARAQHRGHGAGPAVLPPTDFRKSGLLIEVTPAALGFKPIRLSSAPEVFDIAASLELIVGSRTLTLSRAAPEAWTVGREPPATATVTAQLASGERAPVGALPLDARGLTIDATTLGRGEIAPVVLRPPADLATRAAYLAVQVEGHGWRTLDAGTELTLPVRRESRLQPPKLRYRTRHVARREGGATAVISESAWRDAAGETISVEL